MEYCFVVEDFGTESFDFEALKNKGHMELAFIEDMAYVLEVIDFKIDCSHGFKYSGIYPVKQAPSV